MKKILFLAFLMLISTQVEAFLLSDGSDVVFYTEGSTVCQRHFSVVPHEKVGFNRQDVWTLLKSNGHYLLRQNAFILYGTEYASTLNISEIAFASLEDAHAAFLGTLVAPLKDRSHIKIDNQFVENKKGITCYVRTFPLSSVVGENFGLAQILLYDTTKNLCTFYKGFISLTDGGFVQTSEPLYIRGFEQGYQTLCGATA